MILEIIEYAKSSNLEVKVASIYCIIRMTNFTNDSVIDILSNESSKFLPKLINCGTPKIRKLGLQIIYNLILAKEEIFCNEIFRKSDLFHSILRLSNNSDTRITQLSLEVLMVLIRVSSLDDVQYMVEYGLIDQINDCTSTTEQTKYLLKIYLGLLNRASYSSQLADEVFSCIEAEPNVLDVIESNQNNPNCEISTLARDLYQQLQKQHILE